MMMTRLMKQKPNSGVDKKSVDLEKEVSIVNAIKKETDLEAEESSNLFENYQVESDNETSKR